MQDELEDHLTAHDDEEDPEPRVARVFEVLLELAHQVQLRRLELERLAGQESLGLRERGLRFLRALRPR